MKAGKKKTEKKKSTGQRKSPAQTGTSKSRANSPQPGDTMGKDLLQFRDSSIADSPDTTWSRLKSLTAARIALGRAGASQPTQAMLSFQLDHSRARDAIYSDLDTSSMEDALKKSGLSVTHLQSQAADRSQYLKRPDLGRKLSESSTARLKKLAGKRKLASGTESNYDIVFVIADGLSARAVQDHAARFIEIFQTLNRDESYRIGPVCIVEQGRVAIGDPIGEILNASLVAVLIGERPGLSSPDSMGLYLTYSPRIGTTDERRNCISNIRPQGLPLTEGAKRFQYMARQSLTRKLSGVFLKDDRKAGISDHSE
tara:strand:+ start:85317 stop:86255 length:939 start_codon:yes stop_codon:yes gene_type:complete